MVRGRGREFIHYDGCTFHCIDKQSPIQFLPFYEKGVSKIVYECKGLFVDIGANFGRYTVPAAKHGCQVIALEPYPANFDRLCENITLNGIDDKVEVYGVAAWSEKTTLKMSPGIESGTSHISEDGGAHVRACTLDEILDGRKPDLIKIDTEKSEMNVLKGMTHTLSLGVTMILETWDKKSLEECKAFLEPLGYKIRTHRRGGHTASILPFEQR